MSNDEIVQLAILIKKRFPNNNVLEICEKLHIKMSTTKIKPHISPAYTIKSGASPVIILNEHFALKSKRVLCAHELGHVLIHDNELTNQFNGTGNEKHEYEANLFAVALLFNQEDLCMRIEDMDNYILKILLDHNISTI